MQLHAEAADWNPAYELSKNLHRCANWQAVRLVPICIAAPHCGQRQVGASAAEFAQTSKGFGVVVSSCRAIARLAARQRLARKPYWRMRTKSRGRMCWVKRRRNSVALKVILRCLLP